MASLEVHSEHICAACNCTYNCFEFPCDNLLVYGANSALVFYDLEEQKVIRAAVAHGGRINCVRNLKYTSPGKEGLISCSSDGSLAIWRRKLDNEKASYEAVLSTALQKCSVTVCDAIKGDSGSLLVGIITSLSKVALFYYNEEGDTLLEIQELDLKLSVALDLVFHKLDGTVLLALGMDKGSVLLYNQQDGNETDRKFARQLELKKHDDWVRCISFAQFGNEVLLAAGGEDSFISIWRFTASEMDASEFEFQVHKFGKYSVIFDTLIMGHEGWINSLAWDESDPNAQGGLISCSSDQSVIIWDKGESIWVERYRFGTVGGQIPGGFGAKIKGKYLAVCGFQGAVQLWMLDKSQEEPWVLQPSITGHFGPVSDLDYDTGGHYIMTTSEDQTTRVHAPWGEERWHEIARPQIHGHDIFTGKILGDYIVSGSEEKILRSFQPTDVFVKTLENVSGIPVDFIKHVAPAATLPALGLSNLPEEVSEAQRSDPNYFENLSLNARLDEDFLRAHTLWPEVSKLYGHVYEICAIATSPVDPLIASGSQASKPQFASIILWSAESWKNLGEFRFHNLNVTDLEFSKQGDRLLSASRDRTWALWKVVNEGGNFSLKMTESGSFHTRALWVGTWAPTGSFFATGGRDKKLALWAPAGDRGDSETKHEVVASLTLPASVSAASINQDNLVALALETGQIYFYLFSPVAEQSTRLTHLLTLDRSLAHHDVVKRLKFNPQKRDELASAGADKFLRVYRLNLRR